MEWYNRTQLLLGAEGIERLRKSRVAVFGLGGVGGSAAEALARAGVGTMTLVDNDRVSLTNLNRQTIALHSTLGRLKTEVCAERIRDICPDTAVELRECFFLPENAESFNMAEYDYVLDCIDTVSGKLALIERAKAAGTPIITAMGAGNKLDPTEIRVTDISFTMGCPLARVMRRELKKRGITRVKAVWSIEESRKPFPDPEQEEKSPGRAAPGSVSFVPPVMGMIMAGVVVRQLALGER